MKPSLALLLAALVLPLPGAIDSSGVKVFTGARIVDPRDGAVIEPGILLVRQGRLERVGRAGEVEVPDGAERIELGGRTVVPGLINAHGHVGEARGLSARPEFYSRENVLDQLRLYARYGVTTVVGLGGDREAGFRLRDQQATPELTRARLFVAGPVVTGAEPAAAARQVDEVAAMKPDLIKIRVDDNLGTTAKMPPRVYRAIIDRAATHGLRVAAHVFYLEDAKGLLDAGVGFIAHSVRDRPVDRALIDGLKARDVCVCPTLTRELSTFVYGQTPEFFSDPFFLREADPAVLAELRDAARQQQVRESRSARLYRDALDVALRNLKTLSDAGVRIAFGTDTGVPGRFQGYFEHLELGLMAEAGLTPAQILKAATADAARCLELEGVGVLEPGAWADFVVVEGDPLEDIEALRRIESVWIAGNRVPKL
jgi:imidazolonepropionase-like amidohydrolase